MRRDGGPRSTRSPTWRAVPCIVGRGSAGEAFLQRQRRADDAGAGDTADASLELLAEGRYDAALTSRLTGMAIVARSGYATCMPTGPPHRRPHRQPLLCLARRRPARADQRRAGDSLPHRRLRADLPALVRALRADVVHAAGGRALRGGGALRRRRRRRVGVAAPATTEPPRGRSRRASCATMDAELAQGRRLRAVGEMVGGIAHEFNNLLTPIVLKVELLREDRERRPGLQRELDVISGAADRAATLTRRLLTFGRKGDTRARATCSSPDIVAANVDLVRPTCDPRMLVVDAARAEAPAGASSEPGRPPPDRAEPADERARHAARQARTRSDDGRQVIDWRSPSRCCRRRRCPRLAARRTRYRRGHAARGARADLRAVLHHQGSRPRHRSRTGNGLAPRAFVRRRVSVDSTPGVGTTFRVDLPARAATRETVGLREAAASTMEPVEVEAPLLPFRSNPTS